MTVDPTKFKASQASERILPKDPKYGYVGCRFSADWGGTGMATLGESTLRPDGRLKGRDWRRSELMDAWEAAGKGRSGYNQGHVPEIHEAMFPGLPQPIRAVTRDFSDDLWAHLGTAPSYGDHAISVALELSVLAGSSPLRRHTGPVAHQVTLTQRRGSEAKVLDGMAPYNEKNTGYWAPRSDIAKAAKAIEEGLVVFELYPIGGWTQERLMKRRKNQQLAALENKYDDCMNIVVAKQARIHSLQAQFSAKEDFFDAEMLRLQGELDEALDATSVVRADVIDEAIQALESIK